MKPQLGCFDLHIVSKCFMSFIYFLFQCPLFLRKLTHGVSHHVFCFNECVFRPSFHNFMIVMPLRERREKHHVYPREANNVKQSDDVFPL